MIQNQFFDSTYTPYISGTHPDYIVYNATDNINGTDNTNPKKTNSTGEIINQLSNYNNFPDMYWLGWIKPDNMFSPFHPCYFDNSSPSRIVFRDVISDNNIDFGYLANFQSYPAHAIGITQFIINDNGFWSLNTLGNTSTESFRFPNKFNLYAYRTPPSYVNYYEYYCDSFIYDRNNNTVAKTDNNSIYFMLSRNFTDMYNFLYNDGDLQFGFRETTSGSVINITLKASDFSNGYYVKELSENVLLYLTISRLTMPLSYPYFQRDGSTGAFISSNINATLIPTYKFYDTDGNLYVISGNGVSSNTQQQQYYFTYTKTNDSIVFNQKYKNNYGLGGFKGVINKQLQSGSLAVGDNFIYYATTTNIYGYRFLTIDDLKHAYGVQPILDNGNQYVGVSTNRWYAEQLDTYEFTTNLINDATEENKKEKLQEWQYSENGIINNYNSEINKPTPAPTTPVTPDTTKSTTTGFAKLRESVTIGNVQGLTSFYFMDYTQMQTVGKLLMSSLIGAIDESLQTGGSQSIYNFLATSFKNAVNFGDLSLDNVFNAIVSCRVYPFDLPYYTTNWAYARDKNGNITTNIFMGTGNYGYDVSTNPLVLTEPHLLIDLGSVYIPYVYDDWRDVENTDIIIHCPFCGSVNIDPSAVIGNFLQVKYAIDFNTGCCTAYVICYNNDFEYPIATLNGIIGCDISLTRSSADNILSSVVNTATNTVLNGINGNISGILNTHITGKQPQIQAGKFLTSFYDVPNPYIIIKHNKYKIPDNYQTYSGYHDHQTRQIRSLSGFVKCINVNVNGLSTATETEKQQIKNMLENGIYV